MTSKELLTVTCIAGAFVGGGILLKLKRLSEELETVIKANIHKVDLTGVTLRVDITLKNPTGGTVKIKYPFIKLSSAGKALASSEIRNEDYEIPKFSQVQVAPIYIPLSFLTLGSSAPAVLNEYRTTGKLKVNIETVSTINGKLEYKKSEQVTI